MSLLTEANLRNPDLAFGRACRTSSVRFSLIAFLIFGLNTAAKSAPESSPPGEQMNFGVPEGYEVAQDVSVNDVRIRSFVKLDTTSDSGLSVIVIRQVTANRSHFSPTEFLTLHVQANLPNCAQHEVSNNDLDTAKNNGYAASMQIARCNSAAGFALGKIVFGAEYFHSLSVIFPRIGRSTNDNSLAGLEQVGATLIASRVLDYVNVCDARSADHPCR
jgi:hypothetical protein